MKELPTALAAIGILVLGIGLLSRPIKRTIIPIPVLAVGVGVLLGPAGLGWLDPHRWGKWETILEEAARVTLAIALMGVALRLPPGYVTRHWRSLIVLIGYIMPLAGPRIVFLFHGLPRCQRLLKKHHYLGSIKPVGERLYYVATDARGVWLALLVFSAPAKHLKHRDRWIGWTPTQQARRLSLLVNNCRLLLLPDQTVPNLGSKVLGLVLGRLSTDWQARYGHPVLVVESFVDPEQFCGTVYTANGWEELGPTDGWGRCRRDYYVKHDKPKLLFVKELARNARRSLQAEHLKPELAAVERKAVPPCHHKVKAIQAITEHFKVLPDVRERIESYPLWSLLTLILLAVLSGAPRGQKDLAKFAKRLTQPQRRALDIRRNPQGKYPAPCQSTFCRLLQRVPGATIDAVLQAIQEQLRGPAPPGELIVLDGKEPNHGGGDSVLTAVSVPSQYYLGSALVDQKTNEIPVARQLFRRLDLQGRLVSLDALHTQDHTGQDLVLEHGADYLLTVKDNQPTVRQNIEKLLPAPPAGFSPSGGHAHPGPHGGTEQGPSGEPHDPDPARER